MIVGVSGREAVRVGKETGMTTELVIAIVTLIVSIIASYLLARWFGDVAGTKAAIKYEEEKAEKARVVALHSLLNEVGRIRHLAHHNSKQFIGPEVHSVVRLPVTALETVFLSGESVLLEKWQDNIASEVLASVTDYLTEAYSVNALIDLYLGLVRGLSSAEEHRRNEIISQIASKSQGLIEVLDRLEKGLRGELQAMT